MEEKNMKRLVFWMKVGMAIVIIFMIFYLSSKNIDLQYDRNYYRDQMLNFCDFAQMQGEILITAELIDPSEIEEFMSNTCDYWTIENIERENELLEK